MPLSSTTHKRYSLSGGSQQLGATADTAPTHFGVSTRSNSSKGRSKAAKEQQGQRQQQWLLAVTSSLFWCFCSSALIITNKQLYDNGLPFPFVVTGMGQAASALVALLMSATGTRSIRPPPSLPFLILRIGPIVLSCAGTMFFGNVAYLYLSMAFIQVLKTATPAVTLLLGLLARVETATVELVVALGLIMGGTAAAVLLESGAASFSGLGVFLFSLSCITEATRVVWSQLLLGPAKYNSAEVMLYVNAPAAVLLLLCGAVWEGPKGVWQAYLHVLLHKPWSVVLALASSALVNLSSYVAIGATGSLTFKVVGCVKNVGVVLYGALVYGEHVTGLQMVAYAVSMAGFGLYTRAKAQMPQLGAAGAGVGGKGLASRRGSWRGSSGDGGSDGGGLQKLA